MRQLKKKNIFAKLKQFINESKSKSITKSICVPNILYLFYDLQNKK